MTILLAKSAERTQEYRSKQDLSENQDFPEIVNNGILESWKWFGLNDKQSEVKPSIQYLVHEGVKICDSVPGEHITSLCNRISSINVQEKLGSPPGATSFNHPSCYKVSKYCPSRS